MSPLNRKAMLTAAALLFLSAAASAQQPLTPWQKAHPRRAEVNQRLQNQDARIQQGVQSGELTGKEAAKLHAEDHVIRREEQRMAARNGGYITKRQQRKLNRQENHVSQQIYTEKHD